MTSDIFHADDNKDRLTMSVSTGRMQGSASLITDMVTLSNPRALLNENEVHEEEIINNHLQPHVGKGMF